MVFMSSNVDQSDVSIFIHDDALLARFAIFQRGIVEACLNELNGISQNLITIRAYPWSSSDELMRTAARSWHADQL